MAMNGEKISDSIQQLVDEGVIPQAWTIVVQEEESDIIDMGIISSVPPEHSRAMLSHGALQMNELLKTMADKPKDTH